MNIITYKIDFSIKIELNFYTKKAVINLYIFDAVGNTPLFELRKIFYSRRKIKIFGKAEFLNPGGSIKDRSAKEMLKDGISEGKLKPGMEIIDTTGGNVGISYCMMAASMGCKATLFMDRDIRIEHKYIIRAYGGNVIEIDYHEGTNGAYEQINQLIQENPQKYFFPDQHNSPLNWKAHYHNTAEEILHQTEGKVTHFVSVVGTGGTFVGNVKRLKEYDYNIKSVLARPSMSYHGLEGLLNVERDEKQRVFDKKLVDIEVIVKPKDVCSMVKHLAAEEGLLVGMSAAANVLAAIETAKNAPDNSIIVAMLPDSGVRYFDKYIWQT